MDGVPETTKEEMVLIGNVSEDKAWKVLLKEVGSGVTILSVEVNTQIYEMLTKDFIKYAKIK